MRECSFKQKKKNAETRDRTGDLQIFSLTLSQLSYRGSTCTLSAFGAAILYIHALQKSEHPESNQGPFDFCRVYSRTLYQLSYVRRITPSYTLVLIFPLQQKI